MSGCLVRSPQIVGSIRKGRAAIESGQLPPDEVWTLIEAELQLWLRVTAARVTDACHEAQYTTCVCAA